MNFTSSDISVLSGIFLDELRDYLAFENPVQYIVDTDYTLFEDGKVYIPGAKHLFTQGEISPNELKMDFTEFKENVIKPASAYLGNRILAVGSKLSSVVLPKELSDNRMSVHSDGNFSVRLTIINDMSRVRTVLYADVYVIPVE